ncbi:response regulator transcription factor [Alicyclobacillus sp. SO9]|uniref:response regulator transcription factor n=1 Tax=Alicyclobacillus sp. SO9 TaxID=2665646 RepID=UPI001E42F284|nr:response regulator transcription factor [Alicyclobacillus sp. SO9]
MSKVILVVDDESHMRRLIQIYLQNAGYETIEAEDGETALLQMQHRHVHLVVLDLMMPGMDGWETCAEIQSRFPAVPVLMLTARTAVEDKVAGLSMGADDYLTKPFDGRELTARVQALLRRTQLSPDTIELKSIALQIDVTGRNVYVRGKPLSLTPKEYDLLLLLAQNQGRSFQREDLLNRVWGSDYYGGTRTVDSHVKNIREKLREAGIADQDPIRTVWGIGYKFEVVE